MRITMTCAVSALALGVAAGGAAANEARLDVSDGPVGSAVQTLTVTQTPGSESRITQAPQASGNAALADFDYYADGRTDTFFGNNLEYPTNGRGQITGSYETVSIQQGPGSNKLAINVAGRAESDSATIDLSYDGDGNEHTLRVGRDGGARNNFLNASITATVTGDNNDIRDNIRGGGVNALSYDLTITGDDNDVRVLGGNLGSSLEYTATITGSDNFLRAGLGTDPDMNKSLTFTIDGSDNDIRYAGTGTDIATFTGTFTGDGITGRLNQTGGTNQTAVVDVTNEVGAGGFEFTMSQLGANQSVDATVTHTVGGSGSYTITQDASTPGAVYAGATVLAGGGTGTVSQ